MWLRYTLNSTWASSPAASRQARTTNPHTSSSIKNLRNHLHTKEIPPVSSPRLDSLTMTPVLMFGRIMTRSSAIKIVYSLTCNLIISDCLWCILKYINLLHITRQKGNMLSIRKCNYSLFSQKLCSKLMCYDRNINKYYFCSQPTEERKRRIRLK